MKGPGLRIEIDVRRLWRCPVCGQTQKVTLDITAARCNCVRDGVPMKLVEGKRPGRRHLRPELQAILDRIQAGEEFPRMNSPLSSDSEAVPREGGGSGGPRNRPPRPERSGGNRPPRESQRDEISGPSSDSAPNPISPPIAVTPPQQTVSPEEDEFGTGLGDNDSSSPR